MRARLNRFTYPYQIRMRKEDYELAQKYAYENGFLLSENLRGIIEEYARKQLRKENGGDKNGND